MEPIHFYFLEGSNYTNQSLDWIVASSGNFKLLEDNQSNMFSDIFKGHGLGDVFSLLHSPNSVVSLSISFTASPSSLIISRSSLIAIE